MTSPPEPSAFTTIKIDNPTSRLGLSGCICDKASIHAGSTEWNTSGVSRIANQRRRDMQPS
jgi:hypothetical protein